MPDTDVAPVTVVSGPEAFLAERAVGAITARVRQDDPAAEVTLTSGVDLSPARAAEVLGPSLLGGKRVLVVTGADGIDNDDVAGLVRVLGEVPDDARAVLVHPAGQKGQKVLRELRKVAGREISCARLTRAEDLVAFVRGEVRAGGAQVDPDAAQRLVEVLGTDLRSLASAASQLVSDAPGSGHVTRELVDTYFEGRAEVKGWTIADLVMLGKTSAALAELRWALATGTAPVLVVGALAGSVRTLARLHGLPPGMREPDVAKELGVPPWKVRMLRTQLRGWTAQTLGSAIEAVARADLDVKGEASDLTYALSRLVLELGQLKRLRA